MTTTSNASDARLDFAAAWLEELSGAKESARELRKEVCMVLGLDVDAPRADVTKRLKELFDYADEPAAANAAASAIAASVFLAAVAKEQRADPSIQADQVVRAAARKYPELVTAARTTARPSALVRFTANRQLDICARSLVKTDGLSYEDALDRAARERPDLVEARHSGIVPGRAFDQEPDTRTVVTYPNAKQRGGGAR